MENCSFLKISRELTKHFTNNTIEIPCKEQRKSGPLIQEDPRTDAGIHLEIWRELEDGGGLDQLQCKGENGEGTLGDTEGSTAYKKGAGGVTGRFSIFVSTVRNRMHGVKRKCVFWDGSCRDHGRGAFFWVKVFTPALGWDTVNTTCESLRKGTASDAEIRLCEVSMECLEALMCKCKVPFACWF